MFAEELQNPYLVAEFAVGDGNDWEFSTVKQEGHRSATWVTAISGMIDKDTVINQGLEIRAKSTDDNDAVEFIGKNVIDVSNLFSRRGQWVDIAGDLLDEYAQCVGSYKIRGKFRTLTQPLQFSAEVLTPSNSCDEEEVEVNAEAVALTNGDTDGLSMSYSNTFEAASAEGFLEVEFIQATDIRCPGWLM